MLGRRCEQFIRHTPNPVWTVLCDNYFRLEIDGCSRSPDEPWLPTATQVAA